VLSFLILCAIQAVLATPADREAGLPEDHYDDWVARLIKAYPPC
jgi:hypothetical protein